MAEYLSDGTIRMSDGRILDPREETISDILELASLVNRTVPQYFRLGSGGGGRTGPRGPQGLQGTQGSTGPAGPAGSGNIVTGSYVGDDTDGRDISSGLGAPISYLRIIPDVNPIFEPVKQKEMVGNTYALAEDEFTTGLTLSALTDEFKVDRTSPFGQYLNALGTTYYFLAMA